jgi:hypothetical protein
MGSSPDIHSSGSFFVVSVGSFLGLLIIIPSVEQAVLVLQTFCDVDA